MIATVDAPVQRLPRYDAPSGLDAARVARLAGLPAAQVEVVDEVGSTNQALLGRPPGDAPAVLIALRQVAGRGRRGRAWIGDPRDGLAMSVSMSRPLVPGSPALTGLTPALGLALAQALVPCVPDLSLKWPNDLQRDGRKVAGMLVETRHAAGRERVVVGVGINLRVSDALARSVDQPIAGLLDALPEGGAGAPSREEIAGLVARALVDALGRFFRDGFADTARRWPRFDALAGRDVSVVDDGRILFAGRAEGIDETGALRVRTAERVVPVTIGDVSVRAAPRSGAPPAVPEGR
jgi:BirA family biotin operon repressor/biotin-[acetyl-CoA-carboxylase] ligase